MYEDDRLMLLSLCPIGDQGNFVAAYDKIVIYISSRSRRYVSHHFIQLCGLAEFGVIQNECQDNSNLEEEVWHVTLSGG